MFRESHLKVFRFIRCFIHQTCKHQFTSMENRLEFPLRRPHEQVAVAPYRSVIAVARTAACKQDPGDAIAMLRRQDIRGLGNRRDDGEALVHVIVDLQLANEVRDELGPINDVVAIHINLQADVLEDIVGVNDVEALQ